MSALGCFPKDSVMRVCAFWATSSLRQNYSSFLLLHLGENHFARLKLECSTLFEIWPLTKSGAGLSTSLAGPWSSGSAYLLYHSAGGGGCRHPPPRPAFYMVLVIMMSVAVLCHVPQPLPSDPLPETKAVNPFKQVLQASTTKR